MLGFLNMPGYRVGWDGSVWTKWFRGKRGKGNGAGTKYHLGEKWQKMTFKRRSKYLTLNPHQEQGPKYPPRGILIHHVVLLSFIGPKPTPESCGLHWDDDPINNDVLNLRWGTNADNMADKKRTGRTNSKKVQGVKNPNAKLTDDQVRAIRRMWASGKYNYISHIDKELGVTGSWNVIKGGAWSHVK
jgi:hypothetical protein